MGRVIEISPHGIPNGAFRRRGGVQDNSEPKVAADLRVARLVAGRGQQDLGQAVPDAGSQRPAAVMKARKAAGFLLTTVPSVR